MLDKDIMDQLHGLFAGLENEYLFNAVVNPAEKHGQEMEEFLNDVVSTSAKLSLNITYTEGAMYEFSLYKNEKPVGITFRGVPGGHEFNTFLLAILNADGKGLNLPDSGLARRIGAVKGPVELRTYVSLTCTNCPDVAQACNLLSLYNPGISNSVIDGADYPEEMERMNIQAVPMVFAGEEIIAVGRTSMSEILGKLEANFGVETRESSLQQPEKREFDIVVLGGGPAGAAAAIYSARKALKTALVTMEGGGSVSQTGDIENLIVNRATTGSALAAELRANVRHYGVEMFEDREIESVSLKEEQKIINVAGGEKFVAPQVIIATGTRPRHIGAPGETEYIGHGVAYCPHCDGPLFKDKDVAVVGGGNAGIEAAIDLAGICRSVLVVEFLPVLKADQVLQERVKTLKNVKILTNHAVAKIEGNGDRVTGVVITNREDNTSQTIPLSGVFVQIGTVPNTAVFKEELTLNKAQEIVTDRNCRTSLRGVYAAGDVNDGAYKQIVTALGDGATAALAAFDDRIRGGA